MALLAAELLLVRNLEHRVPVDRRIVMRRLGGIGRRHRAQVEHRARARRASSANRPGRSRAPRRGNSPPADRAGHSGPRSSVTTILMYRVGRSRGLRDDPDAGLRPMAPVTTPPMSCSLMRTAAAPLCCAFAGAGANAKPRATAAAATPRYKPRLIFICRLPQARYRYRCTTRARPQQSCRKPSLRGARRATKQSSRRCVREIASLRSQ